MAVENIGSEHIISLCTNATLRPFNTSSNLRCFRFSSMYRLHQNHQSHYYGFSINHLKDQQILWLKNECRIPFWNETLISSEAVDDLKLSKNICALIFLEKKK